MIVRAWTPRAWPFRPHRAAPRFRPGSWPRYWPRSCRAARACLAGLLLLGGPAAAQTAALEPEALALLKGAGAALAGARTMSFTATALHDVPNAEGQSILYTVQSRVSLRRPDRLRVETTGDGPPSEFVSDGRTMTLYRPRARTVATAPAPASLEAVLKAEAAVAGQSLAFADMLLAQTEGTFTQGLTRAFVVGRSTLVGGVETAIVAFAAPDAQGQIWIGAQDRLPRQLWVTETAAPGRPRSGVSFGEWRLDAPLDDSAFTAADAAGAAPVPFTQPDL
ncbi:DUF2092 domain-containing protein [Methylobacterium oryzisoli]|uniref:DUF2092 domain-containing protein n=1 Tax=Methylobacterium oryzisoli TaxID=3385502 RepID=UPI003892399E